MLASQLLRKQESRYRTDNEAKLPNGVHGEDAPHTKKRKRPEWRTTETSALLTDGVAGFLGLEELEGTEYERLTSFQNDVCNAHDSSETSETRHSMPDNLQHSTDKGGRRKLSQSGRRVDRPFLSGHANIAATSRITNNVFSTLAADVKPVDLPAWQPLKLSENVLRGLQSLNYTEPTQIQRLSIPMISSGQDVIGKASTGSGKTLAFGIPVIEHLLESKGVFKGIIALILAPTRELVQQIAQHLKALCTFTDARIMTITGGLSIEKQLRQLQQEPDIIVATPGRVWDILSTRQGLQKHFQGISFLVLDEADRILQQGHFQEVSRILEVLGPPDKRQTLIFSATFHYNLQAKLAKGRYDFQKKGLSTDESLELLLKNIRFRKLPQFVDANPKAQVAQAVRQCVIEVCPTEKDYFLYYLLLRYPCRTLIFTNSIADVHRLVQLLNTLGMTALGLHSNMQQKARLKSIERFKIQSNAVLVASDVAARGLDIHAVDFVLHYHLPPTADLYIHRSGRTARGTARGLSIALCSSNETLALKKLKQAIKVDEFTNFPVDTGYVNTMKPRVNLARRIIHIEGEARRKRPRKDPLMSEAADDLGITLTDDEESTNHSSQQQAEVRTLRLKLSKEISRPIKNGINGKYLTRGGSDLAHRLLSGNTHSQFLGEKIQTASDTIYND